MRSVHLIQGPVVRKVDNAIHWINLYPVDNAIDFPNTYPLDRGIAFYPVGSIIQRLNNRSQVCKNNKKKTKQNKTKKLTKKTIASNF